MISITVGEDISAIDVILYFASLEPCRARAQLETHL